jgi:hypothetical protein
VRCTRFAHIIFECNECQQEGDGCYKETWYEDTIPRDIMYSDIDPKPEWKCPKHPNSDFSSSTMSECSALISGSPYKCKQHGGYKNDR